MKRKMYDQLLLWKNKRKGKSGFTTSSLNKCVKKYSTHLSQAYIVHTGDVMKNGDYLYIPLYMVPCL